MIQGYLKIQFIEKVSQNCSLYKATKEAKPFFMYEYTTMNACDQYNFKILKKLVACSHVLGIIQKFEANNATYFITEYIESNLLKQQLKQPHQVFELSKALQKFAQIVQIIEQLHQNNVIYRNLRLQTIGFDKDQLFLSDFSFSQIVKRKQRFFEAVGVPIFTAPQFYLEDGYGYQVDVWASGVCLFYMVTGSYPFNCDNKNEQQILLQIQRKTKKGFDFVANASQSKKAKYIQSSKSLEDLFKKIFEYDYSLRITIAELKLHPAISGYFNDAKIQGDISMMSVIEEQSNNPFSIFMSMLKNFESHHEFHKQEIILDFMEHSSQILMLDSPEFISEELRTIVRFSILKVAVFKANRLIDVLYGKKEPDFKISVKEWEEMRKTSAFGKVKQKIQRKRKILEMLFRSAYMDIQNFKPKSLFYSDQIPEDFAAIKHEYRNNLAKMFEIDKQIMKKKERKEKVRKTCENLARLTISCMINRVFQEQNLKENFKLYYEWSKKQSLESLNQWIQNEKINNLKIFIKTITSKYME